MPVWVWFAHTADHPRSRGEYFAVGWLLVAAGGSSPLSRGIRPPPAVRTRRRGIIPALAGNTTWYARNTPSAADHPRSRGEYVTGRQSFSEIEGSSPLSRGILFVAEVDYTITRIIPALAGNTGAPMYG